MDIKKISRGCGYAPWRYPCNWIDNAKYFWRNIKARWQRAWYGVSIVDCWDLDFYFLHVLENGLIIYKRDTNGYPGTITYEEWLKILDRMIELVQILQIDWFEYEGPLEYKDFQTYYNRNKAEFLKLMMDWSGQLWW